MKLLKFTLILFVVGCFFNCSKKKQENREIQSQRTLEKVHIRTGNKYIDSILNVKDSVTITNQLVKDKLFNLNSEDPFFLAIKENKIIAKLDYDGGNKVWVFNPYTHTIYNKLDLDDYSFEFIEQNSRGGYNPDESIFAKNNNGDIKVLITDGANPSDEFSIFCSISNLEKNKSRPLILNINQSKKKLIVSDLNKLFNFENFVFYNDTLYDLSALEYIEVLDSNILLYSIIKNSEERSFKFKNDLILKEKDLINVALFPINNNIFFYTSDSDYTNLYRYNIKTGISKKYILPFITNKFYFSDDGFFTLCNELNEINQSRRDYNFYSFIKY